MKWPGTRPFLDLWVCQAVRRCGAYLLRRSLVTVGSQFDVELHRIDNLFEALIPVITEMRSAYPAADISYLYDAALPVQGDFSRLSQLLSNHVHHGAPGGPISITGSVEGADLTLCFTNKGKAIAAEQMDRCSSRSLVPRESVKARARGWACISVLRSLSSIPGGCRFFPTRVGQYLQCDCPRYLMRIRLADWYAAPPLDLR